MKTKIKICGITLEQDLETACSYGADALGFVFYPPSPRNITAERARRLLQRLPPFVASVGLFVNPTADEVHRILDIAPLSMLQFHGHEPAEFCASFGRPWLKAARIGPNFDFNQFITEYGKYSAYSQPSGPNHLNHLPPSGFLLDADSPQFGGSGQTFDWQLIPPLPRPIVLAGGLDASNVGQAIALVRPYAVDVSSGVEASKGIKSVEKLKAFCEAVRRADKKVRRAENTPLAQKTEQ